MTTSAVTRAAAVATIAGLSSSEAAIGLKKDGPNTMPDVSAHPLRNALLKFWAPVPWLLEAAIVLQVVLHLVRGDLVKLLDGVKIPVFARLQIS